MFLALFDRDEEHAKRKRAKEGAVYAGAEHVMSSLSYCTWEARMTSISRCVVAGSAVTFLGLFVRSVVWRQTSLTAQGRWYGE